MRPTARLSGLDGLRGLAALGVVALHVCLYAARPWAPWDAGDGLLKGLRLGVVLFFVLSGFLLSRPWLAASRGERERPSTGRYLIRRAARVLPAYYAALLLGAVVLAGTGSPRMATAHDVPLLLTLRQNLSPVAQAKLVPPAWTLSVEMSFYLLLPLAGLALVRWGTTQARRLGLCAAVAGLSVAFNGLVDVALPAYWHRTLPADAYAFAAGIAAAALVGERRLGAPQRLALLAGGWALAALDALAHVPWALPGHDVWWDLPAALGFAAVVAAAATGPGTVLGSAPLRWLGHRGYGLYLTHYPVILLFTARHSLPRDPRVAFAVVLGLSLVLADLFLRGIERPCMRLAARIPRQRRRAPARARRPALELDRGAA
jgi:peptidoglycan/LPS O-acetylase OafA/YrhL